MGNRANRKLKNLRKILEQYVSKKQRERYLKRIKKQEMDAMCLEDQLNNAIDDDKRLTEIQYENAKEIMDGIVKEQLEHNFTQLRLLRANMIDRLLVKTQKQEQEPDRKVL